MMVVQSGVPVTDPVEGDDRIEAGVLPAGRYATTTHVGHSDGSTTPPNRVEWYETNPMEQPDVNQWVTRLTFRLAD